MPRLIEKQEKELNQYTQNPQILLPENFAFVLANSISKATNQAVTVNVTTSNPRSPGEVTNINNNINFYGPVQLQAS